MPQLVLLLFAGHYVCVCVCLWVCVLAAIRTASPKPSSRAPRRVGNAVVSIGNAGWTSKSGHPSPCQNCSQGPPAEKTEEDLCRSVPHVPSNIGQGAKLNCCQRGTCLGRWCYCHSLEARGEGGCPWCIKKLHIVTQVIWGYPHFHDMLQEEGPVEDSHDTLIKKYTPGTISIIHITVLQFCFCLFLNGFIWFFFYLFFIILLYCMYW